VNDLPKTIDSRGSGATEDPDDQKLTQKTTEQPDLIGSSIGNIEVIDRLGAGGMGEVYLGIDHRLDRRVALKTLHAQFDISSATKARFRREAQILSRLDHPGICRLYDLVEGERDSLVLEYVQGRPMGEISGHLAKDEVVRIGRDIADALAMCRRALDLRRTAFGTEHPKVASTMTNCAQVLEEIGHYEEALELMEEAFQMRLRLLGPDHPSVFHSLTGLSQLLNATGREDEAEAYLHHAIRLAEGTLPPEHVNLGKLKSNLSVVAIRAERWSEAADLAQDILQDLEANPSPKNDTMAAEIRAWLLREGKRR